MLNSAAQFDSASACTLAWMWQAAASIKIASSNAAETHRQGRWLVDRLLLRPRRIGKPGDSGRGINITGWRLTSLARFYFGRAKRRLLPRCPSPTATAPYAKIGTQPMADPPVRHP